MLSNTVSTTSISRYPALVASVMLPLTETIQEHLARAELGNRASPWTRGGSHPTRGDAWGHEGEISRRKSYQNHQLVWGYGRGQVVMICQC